MNNCTKSDIIIIRHRKENLKKCSLRYVELNEPNRFQIYSYPKDFFKKNIDFPENSLLLHINGKELDSSMTGPLIILDGTWRYSESMYTMLPSIQQLSTCSLPIGWRTAYPRKQGDCSDPARGLASIEAIYAACLITKRETKGLLDGYFWKDIFLKINEELIEKYM